MIERLVRVKSAEFVDGQKGPYMKAQFEATDNKKSSTQAVFDGELQKIIQQAEREDKLLLVKLEKQGNFWNLKEAHISKEQAETATVSPSGLSDRDKQILVGVAFKGATECEGYWYVPDGTPHNARVLQSTAWFYDGLLDIVKASPIVLQALKEGGQVIKG